MAEARDPDPRGRPLAPVYFNSTEDNNSDALVTRVPFKVVVGACDGAVRVIVSFFASRLR